MLLRTAFPKLNLQCMTIRPISVLFFALQRIEIKATAANKFLHSKSFAPSFDMHCVALLNVDEKCFVESGRGSHIPSNLGFADIGVAYVALQADEGAHLFHPEDLFKVTTIQDVHPHAPFPFFQELLLLAHLLPDRLDFNRSCCLLIDMAVHIKHAQPPALNSDRCYIPQTCHHHLVDLPDDVLVFGCCSQSMRAVTPPLGRGFHKRAPEHLCPKQQQWLQDYHP
mmetsp:Transcript_30103/g.79329  ORF Transcript_30103/g.79329 Transcript_30103/m.79329 type:complete len:225 (+) Transcript_30103:1611-2285(+)